MGSVAPAKMKFPCRRLRQTVAQATERRVMSAVSSPNMREKLKRKNCDLLVLNQPASMGAARAEFTLLSADGSAEPLGTLDKTELAARLIEQVEKLAAGRAGSP